MECQKLYFCGFKALEQAQTFKALFQAISFLTSYFLFEVWREENHTSGKRNLTKDI